MKLRRKYIPFIPQNFNAVNSDIAKSGLQNAMANILKKTHTNLIVKGVDKKMLQVLQEESVILVANHPHEIEPVVLLASLPKNRNSVSIVTNVKFVNFLSNLNKYIIPVYIQHHFGKAIRLSTRAKLFGKLDLSDEKIDYKTAHQRNVDSIKIASQKIDMGNLVIIFPGEEQTHWFFGVGYLLKGTKTKKGVYFVKAYIRGTKKFDLLRILPFVRNYFPHITVTFTKAKKVNSLRKYDGKKITSILENDYRKWRKSLLQ
jgi:hypothetical protein